MWTTAAVIARWQIGAMFQLASLHKKSARGDTARSNLTEFARLLERHGDALQREQAKALRDLLDGKKEGTFNGTTYTSI